MLRVADDDDDVNDDDDDDVLEASRPRERFEYEGDTSEALLGTGEAEWPDNSA
jgi:hypothetical protein